MRHLLRMAILIPAFLAVAVAFFRYGNQDLFTVFLSFSICGPVLYLITDRFVQKNTLLSMKEEALRSELALLKNQINPHFFFNTLNNLYGLAREKSDLTPTLILKLSELMRFTIYEGKKDHVFLRDEVSYLENYLDIQAIRIRTKKVSLQFEKHISDDLVQIPPLLLIMLVENAFKHGVGSLVEQAFVHMELSADQHRVQFKIENNYEPKKKSPSGIGLSNMKRRLKLIFPNRHHYSAKAERGIYRATLELQL